MKRNELDARRNMLNQLFEDWYIERKRLYLMNLIRGILFGFGSVLGGTVGIALLLWILSFFVDFPLIGETLKDIRDIIKSGGDAR